MEVYRTEEEQIDVLRNWLQKNGRAVLIGATIMTILILGYRLWQSNRHDYNEAAFIAYQEIVEAAHKAADVPEIAAKPISVTGQTVDIPTSLEGTTLNTLGQKLLEDYPKSTYAQFTALLLAKQAVHDHQLKQAVTQLQWILDHHPEENLRLLVQLRLARVLSVLNRDREALALLKLSKENRYSSLYKEFEGDLYVKQGKVTEARKAYQAAQALLVRDAETMPLLKMKLDDLASASKI